MRWFIASWCLVTFAGWIVADEPPTKEAGNKEPPKKDAAAQKTAESKNASKLAAAFKFREVDYFARWAMNDQHEFTPKDQEDLEKWTDMVTINVHRQATDGDKLAAVANSVLGNYQRVGRILKTDSVPRTKDRPAEHLAIVQFNQPKFVEIAFARFKLVDGIGCVIVVSHRIYGDNARAASKEWLTENADKIEKSLMEWTSFPAPASLSAKP